MPCSRLGWRTEVVHVPVPLPRLREDLRAQAYLLGRAIATHLAR